MSKVILNNHAVSFEACINLMDDDIREKIHMEYAPNLNDQDFCNMYCDEHFKKYGQDFEI